MKSFITLILVVIFLSNPLFSQAKKFSVPKKIHQLMQKNNDFDPESGRHRYIAWGVAQDKSGKSYYWYSFINSDAWYQFRFDHSISKSDSVQFSKILDGFQRPYESNENWVGASNDWAFSHVSPITCYKQYTGKWFTDYEGKKQREYYEVVSLSAATTKYVKMMRKVFTKFEVAGVHPDIVTQDYGWALR